MEAESVRKIDESISGVAQIVDNNSASSEETAAVSTGTDHGAVDGTIRNLKIIRTATGRISVAVFFREYILRKI